MFPTEAGQGEAPGQRFLLPSAPTKAAPLQKSYEEESHPGQNWTQPAPG